MDSYPHNYHGAIDNPDTRDYTQQELVGNLPIIDLPKRVILNRTPYLDQGNVGACTVFGCSGAWFETLAQIMGSINEPYKQPYDPWMVWAEAKKRGASDTYGWYIQSALQLLTDMGLIGGYVKIGDSGRADWYTLRYWLSKKFPIVYGSQKGDWGLITRTGRYSESDANQGHCYYGNGYDINIINDLHNPNSWGGAGDFWMDFDKYGKKLFTQYIIIETKDVGILKDIKGKRKEEALAKAREYKLWNEERPNDIATDEEICLIINRALKISTFRTRSWYVDIFYKKILQGKMEIVIWNKLNGLIPPTKKELATLFTRSALRDPSATSGKMTREQVAIVVARDLI